MPLQPARRQTSRYLIRGFSVFFDFDIAAAYGLTTRDLNRIVKRNPTRFPPETTFRLTDDEFRAWKSKNTIASLHLRNCRHRPYVFTHSGYVMLLSLLSSDFAIKVFLRLLHTNFR